MGIVGISALLDRLIEYLDIILLLELKQNEQDVKNETNGMRSFSCTHYLVNVGIYPMGCASAIASPMQQVFSLAGGWFYSRKYLCSRI